MNKKLQKDLWRQRMNEWIYSLDRITVSQAGTPRHDNCVRLSVSWKPINNWLRTIVKTSITNKSYVAHVACDWGTRLEVKGQGQGHMVNLLLPVCKLETLKRSGIKHSNGDVQCCCLPSLQPSKFPLWPPCYTRAISERFRDKELIYKALYKFAFFTLLLLFTSPLLTATPRC